MATSPAEEVAALREKLIRWASAYFEQDEPVVPDADYDAAIAADKQATKDNKVFGVPFFIVEDAQGQEPFWGQDRWAMMVKRLGV